MLLMHQSHVLLTERRGLGSSVHSRDAELYALILAIDQLNTMVPPDYIKRVIIISDAALVLQQLQKGSPQSGHALAEQWWDKVLLFL